jgi:hypothetical protein
MATITLPVDIRLYRLVHVDALPTMLTRGALYAPNYTPNDGLPYRTIHNVSVQASRHSYQIWCGPRGTCHDYVPFYFGPLSVMLLNLKTGRVEGYNEGQAPLIYLTTTVQRVRDAGSRFVFSDGHGLARFTSWYDDLAQLDKVDWNLRIKRAGQSQGGSRVGHIPTTATSQSGSTSRMVLLLKGDAND